MNITNSMQIIQSDMSCKLDLISIVVTEGFLRKQHFFFKACVGAETGDSKQDKCRES